jgi:hypothetical protein
LWNNIIKFLKLKKLGISGVMALLCIACFLGSQASIAKADGSISALPISRGGTGANAAAEARANLNAQEQLISGTNIKTIFGKSLLSSGNISPFVPINSVAKLEPGEQTFIIPSTLAYRFENIIFSVDGGYSFTIEFSMPSWSTSYVDYSCSNGTRNTLFFGNSADAGNKTFTIPSRCFFLEASYKRKWGLFFDQRLS